LEGLRGEVIGFQDRKAEIIGLQDLRGGNDGFEKHVRRQ
jgi:hypothetical protein